MIVPTIENLRIALDEYGIHWYHILERKSIEECCRIVIEIPLFHYLFKMREVKKFLKQYVIPAGVLLIISRKY